MKSLRWYREAATTCENCGERVYSLGCVNCNEANYIAQQSLRYREAASVEESEQDAPDDYGDLLPCGCCLCGGLLSERDAVHTSKGMAHEECAEKRWPFDPHRDLGIPRGEL